MLGATGTAFAGEDAWGTPEDAEKCAKENTQKTPEWVNGNWLNWKDGVPHEPDQATADCKAEIAKRAQVCLKDADEQKRLEAAKTEKPKKGGDGKMHKSMIGQLVDTGDDGARMWCSSQSWDRLVRQRAQAVKDKAAADARKANADKAELPKPSKKDATIEGMVKATYAKAFPSASVLSVVIVSDDWSTERNDYGTVIGRNIQVAVVNQQKDDCEIYSELWYQEYIGGAVKGPVSERGAGSLTRTPITCSKVPGAKK